MAVRMDGELNAKLIAAKLRRANAARNVTGKAEPERR